MLVTSHAAADRGINVKVDGKVEVLIIRPGQTVDVTLVDPRDRIFYGLIAKGEFVLPEVQKTPEAPPAAHETPVIDAAAKAVADKAAADKEAAEKAAAEAAAKEAAEAASKAKK